MNMEKSVPELNHGRARPREGNWEEGVKWSVCLNNGGAEGEDKEEEKMR